MLIKAQDSNCIQLILKGPLSDFVFRKYILKTCVFYTYFEQCIYDEIEEIKLELLFSDTDFCEKKVTSILCQRLIWQNISFKKTFEICAFQFIREANFFDLVYLQISIVEDTYSYQ